MLNTRLLLIEGLPGAGKTSTTTFLGQILQNHGLDCHAYLEEDPHNPIDCIGFELKDLCQKMPPLWQGLTDRALCDLAITLIESRLWQNTACFMFMSEYSIADILHYHRLVWQVLAPLHPCLLVLDPLDVAESMQRIYTLRGAHALEKDIQLTSSYPWFQSRGLHDLAGWIQFFEAWQPVAGLLYQDWPYEKVRITDPHANWELAHQQIFNFLQLDEPASLKQ
jgi:hypothetical protein